ncbi:Cytochrome P450 [Canna indica]|uniref:Cytochrome P450 n=1 Tax=Canna indica TaxID=4628 RepID=A0AAQ3KD98_9LILI|nr:Cytochrome P450 [Canna indica]
MSSSLQSILSLLIIPLSSLLLLVLLRIKSRSQTHVLPPSPPGLPLIGNLHQIGPLLHRSLAALSRTHGPLMLLHLGRVPVLVVSSPDAARDVLRHQDHVSSGRPATAVAKALLYGCRDLGFCPYGDYWRQLRKICAVHLLSSKRVQSYRLAREEEVAAMIASIASSSKASSTVDMSAVLYSFTNDSLCRAVSGKFKREEGRKKVLTELVHENSVLLNKFCVGDYFPWLSWVDRFVGFLERAKKIHKRWDELLDEMIKEHADRLRAPENKNHEEKDFVDVLLSLENDSEIEFVLTPLSMKALLVDMFGAGTETSYVALEWAMAELIRNPRVMKKLQDEVRGLTAGRKTPIKEEELNQITYLKAVIKETLRLHPPAPLLIPRELLEDCTIQGYSIPKKTRIYVNAWAIGRDSKYWDAPEEFRPERFVEDAALDLNGNDFRYLPFGSGRRICPGLHFAVASLELALANLVRHFDWELPGKLTTEELHMEEAVGLVVGREGALRLVAKPWSI